jgi:hypothetical protein
LNIRAIRLQLRNLTSDLYGLSDSADLQLRVNSGSCVNLHKDARDIVSLETCRFDVHLVGIRN